VICWSCEREAGAAPLCAACGALQPPDDEADFFAVLGQPARYAVDLAAAEAAFKQLSRQVHPDRFATADPRARRASLARTVQLNEAWRTIKDPVARAEYMLTRAGVYIGDDARKKGAGPVDGNKGTREVAAPPAFLLEILELNDELDAAKRAGDAVKVAFMAEEMRGRADASMATIAAALEAATPERLDEAARALIALRYQRRFLESAAPREESHHG
jgi:molecular chaperone HscB